MMAPAGESMGMVTVQVVVSFSTSPMSPMMASGMRASVFPDESTSTARHSREAEGRVMSALNSVAAFVIGAA
jgi:hypothetical protein